MMKRTYESPELDLLKISFEATMDSIHYSKPEDFNQSGQEGNDDDIPGGG